MYREKIIVSVHIADIHIGNPAVSPEEMKFQLNEKFIKPISEMMILDIISINGDLAHDILSFNSKHAEVYLWFMNRVVEVAKQKKSIVIVIKGTLSHDFEQLENLKIYNDKTVYFVNAPTVIEEKNIKIYCLPDIHVKSIEEERNIYGYKDNTFDMILGHGTVTETQFTTQEGEHHISKNIVYNTKELIRMCKGPILFGHIHTYMKIKNQVYYISSFTRFIHGEELDKGSLLSVYLPDEGKYIIERIINDLAFNFNEFNIGHETFEKLEAEEIIKKVEKFIEDESVDKLCLVINYVNSDTNTSKVQVIRTYFLRNKKIVNKMKFKALSRKEAEIIKEELQIDESKKYLLDKSMRFEEKMQKFIREEYGTELSIEKIETLLTGDSFIIRK